MTCEGENRTLLTEPDARLFKTGVNRLLVGFRRENTRRKNRESEHGSYNHECDKHNGCFKTGNTLSFSGYRRRCEIAPIHFLFPLICPDEAVLVDALTNVGGIPSKRLACKWIRAGK